MCAYQSRYVGYFEQVKKQYDGELPPTRTLQLTSITVHNISGKPGGISVHIPLISARCSQINSTTDNNNNNNNMLSFYIAHQSMRIALCAVQYPVFKSSVFKCFLRSAGW